MSVIKSGRIIPVQSRVGVTAADTAGPQASDLPEGTAAGIVRVPVQAKGQTTHVVVSASVASTSASMRVTIWGAMDFSTPVGASESTWNNAWFPLAGLNSRTGITPSTTNPLGSSSILVYAEALSHVSAWTWLYAQLTNFTDISSTGVLFLFEV